MKKILFTLLIFLTSLTYLSAENKVKRILKSQERKRNSSKTSRIFPPGFDMKEIK